MFIIIDALGWAGAIALLLGYYCIAQSIVDNESIKYHAINLFGALALTINASYYQAYPFILVNSFWVIISMVKIRAIYKQKA